MARARRVWPWSARSRAMVRVGIGSSRAGADLVGSSSVASDGSTSVGSVASDASASAGSAVSASVPPPTRAAALALR